MVARLDALARYARPLLLVVPGLLSMGAFIAVLGLPFIGWSVYAVGYLGLLIAVPAVAAVYRSAFDVAAWLWLGLFYAGVVLGVPVMLGLWAYYAQNPGVQQVLMPYGLTPLAMLPGVLAWAGLGLFGLATFGPRSVPRSGAVLFVLAALCALPAELAIFVFPMWGLGVVLASLGLVAVAPLAPARKPAFGGG